MKKQIFMFSRQHFTEEQAQRVSRKYAEQLASVEKNKRVVWQYNGISSSFITDFNNGSLNSREFILTIK